MSKTCTLWYVFLYNKFCSWKAYAGSWCQSQVWKPFLEPPFRWVRVPGVHVVCCTHPMKFYWYGAWSVHAFRFPLSLASKLMNIWATLWRKSRHIQMRPSTMRWRGNTPTRRIQPWVSSAPWAQGVHKKWHMISKSPLKCIFRTIWLLKTNFHVSVSYSWVIAHI